MRRAVAILAILALILAPMPAVRVRATTLAALPQAESPVTCGKPDDPGLIVYLDVEDNRATPEAEGIKSAVVIFAPDGTEKQRVPLQDVPNLYPLGVGCSLLVGGIDPGPFLLEPASGTTHPLAVPDGYDDSLFPFFAWQRTYQERRWAFLSDAQVTHALLTDTETGNTVDLESLVRHLRGDESKVVVMFGLALSSDESSFLIMTDVDTWVVTTADPTQARQLPAAVPGRAAFSEDGTKILYAAETGNETSDIVVENLDGSGRTVLAKADKRPIAVWIPGSAGREVLILRAIGDQVSVLDVEDGTERAIPVSLPGPVAGQPMFSPSGRQVLLRTQEDETAWTLVDLIEGTGATLDELAGYAFPYAPYAPGVRWLQFFPSDTPRVEPGTSIMGLDLETGAVRPLLTFDIEEPYAGILNFSNLGSSPDGRFVAVNDLGSDYPRFWLVDAKLGTATLYDDRIAGSFSPDGHSLVVSEPAGAENDRLWRTLIMSVDGKDVRTLAESLGRGGFWLPGTHTR
ncbi:MAG: hypothetical protein QOF73_4689 [Thermomicrobiales bacterium]|nr:hypothetical protein [Thermomicrobiales bacterium]